MLCFRDAVWNAEQADMQVCEATVVTVWTAPVVVYSSIDWLGDTVTDVGGTSHHAP